MKNLPYIRHYKKLDQQFLSIKECYDYHKENELNHMKNKMRTKGSIDVHSIFGTYMRINPDLQSPKMYHDMSCLESVRTIITKYRTGSHSLPIQSGRLVGEERDERKCICNDDIQTIDHVLFDCNLTRNITSLINNGGLEGT